MKWVCLAAGWYQCGIYTVRKSSKWWEVRRAGKWVADCDSLANAKEFVQTLTK